MRIVVILRLHTGCGVYYRDLLIERIRLCGVDILGVDDLFWERIEIILRICRVVGRFNCAIKRYLCRFVVCIRHGNVIGRIFLFDIRQRIAVADDKLTRFERGKVRAVEAVGFVFVALVINQCAGFKLRLPVTVVVQLFKARIRVIRKALIHQVIRKRSRAGGRRERLGDFFFCKARFTEFFIGFRLGLIVVFPLACAAFGKTAVCQIIYL